MDLKESRNLDEFGNKEVTILGEELEVHWNKRSKYTLGRSSPGYYEGTTSYSYEEDGETKTEYFVSKNVDSEVAWENLINNIENYLKEIKS